MPVFEYLCESCGHAFEELVRDPAKPSVACPKCGKGKVARQFSVFAARSGANDPREAGSGAGCGRCGDPSGPCGM